MKTALICAAAILVLPACSRDAAAPNNSAADANAAAGAATADPATTNLSIGSPPAAVDQAINRTDRNSGVGNAVDSAANQVTQ